MLRSRFLIVGSGEDKIRVVILDNKILSTSDKIIEPLGVEAVMHIDG
jgi:hypothetical protein